MNNNELKMLQSLPLDVKIAKTKLRINEAIDYFGADHLYVPVSGGKDSTVLSFLVEEVQKERGIPKKAIPRVNSNTGNEYDDVLENARSLSDLEVRPKHNLIWVLTNDGYPIGSKKVSRMLRDLQNPTETNYNSRKLYLEGIKKDGSKSKSFKLPKKYYPFINSCIRCSEKCCYYLKKEPMHTYERDNKRHPILGTMAAEGGTRKSGYLQTGCNAFKTGNGKSIPLGFWTENDILMTIKLFSIQIPKSYGYIVDVNTGETPTYKDVKKAIDNGILLNLTTTGEKRTGCVWCLLGIGTEKGENRFQRLKKIDPKKYKFAIEGGTFDDKGKLIPKGGLGIGKILDMMNIKY